MNELNKKGQTPDVATADGVVSTHPTDNDPFDGLVYLPNTVQTVLSQSTVSTLECFLYSGKKPAHAVAYRIGYAKQLH
jgi:hypothetical protein